MAQIDPVYTVSAQQLKANMGDYLYHPMAIARLSLQNLSEVSQGVGNVVDASTPWSYLLEASSTAVSAAVDKMSSGFRSLYPKLATTEPDVYKHMSDIDYVNSFASPSSANFFVAISVDDIRTKMNQYTSTIVTGPNTTATYVYRDFLIPRSSSVKIGEFYFTFEYSIIIRTVHRDSSSFDTTPSAIRQQLTIFYDSSVDSPLQSLTTNIIDYEIRADADGKQWIYFSTPLIQAQITKTTDIITSSSYYQKSIPITDKYYYTRAFYKNNTTTGWKEFKITHSKDVFDTTIATLVVEKVGNSINVSLPLVYSSVGGIVGDIMILVYTTKGKVNVDMSTYNVGEYVTYLTDHYMSYEDTASVDYASYRAMSRAIYLCYSIDIINGGDNELSFDQLRWNVINDTLGDRKTPITDSELENTQVTRDGFEIIKNVDVLTNRAFLAVKKLPKPSAANILTPANIGISPVIFQTVKEDDFNLRFMMNGSRITLMSETLFKDNNGILSLITNDAEYFNMSVDTLNSNRYMYNPFYYVLDASGKEFSSRAYDLDSPKVNSISFEEADVRFGVNVSTDQYSITKIASGYKLVFTTKSTAEYHAIVANAYVNMDDTTTVDEVLIDAVQAHVSIYDSQANHWMYFRAKAIELINPSTDVYEVKYEVIFNTNYDLDEDSRLAITNSSLSSATEDVVSYVDLLSNVRIVHLVGIANTTATVSTIASYYNSSMSLGYNLIPISLQSLKITFGTYLKNLWSRCRSYATDAIYKRYTMDVPMVYDQDVYANGVPRISIVNDQVVYNQPIHKAGDPTGLILHHAGDIMVDANNNLVEIEEPYRSMYGLDRELDILLVDAKYLYATAATTISYKKEISATLVSWITNNIKKLQSLLINQSKIFFYPKTTLAKTNVWIDDVRQVTIDSEQSLSVDLYVTSRISKSKQLQLDIKSSIIKLLDSSIDSTYVSISDITPNIKNLYPQEIVGVKLYGLGGAADYQVLYIKKEYNRLCIKKKLEKNIDGTTQIVEDVTVNFYNVDRLGNT